tara:strand:- start:135 stop:3569 length:3435 start_codon:yes stop_codon:yes gene_type:complete
MAVLDVKLPNLNLEAEASPSSLLQKEEERRPATNPNLGVDKMAQALAVEVAIAEGGRQASAFLGPVGYVLGSLASGAAGSLAAQEITNPEKLSYGRLLADSLINLIPGAKAYKASNRATDALTRQAGIGAAIGVGGITSETVIDEGRIPTIEELSSAGLTAGALGGALGLTGAGVSKLLTKHGASSVDQINKLIDDKSDPELTNVVERLYKLGQEHETEAQTIFKENFLRTQELLSDESIRPRLLQEHTGGGQIRDNGPLKLKSYESKEKGPNGEDVSIKVIDEDQQDYYTKKRIMDSKIRTQIRVVEAENKLIEQELTRIASQKGIEPGQLSKDLDNYLYARYAVDYNKTGKKSGLTTDAAKNIIAEFEKRNLNKSLKGPIDALQNIINRTNKLAVDSGLLSKEQLKKYKEEYGENYVPLKRQIEKETAAGVSPRDIKIAIYEDVGSDIDVKSIRSNIMEDYADMSRKAEINKTNLAFINLINNPLNKDAASSLFRQKGTKGFGIEGRGNKNTTLNYFDNGVQYHLDFADPQLARAFKGTSNQDMSAVTKAIFNFGTSMNRYLGSIYTRLNPDFVIPNLFRDRTEALVNNSMRLSFREGLETINPMKTISEDMAIIRNKLNNIPAENAKQRELYSLYDEFVGQGGNVGGLGLTTRQDILDTINKFPNNLDASNPAKILKPMGEWIDKVNIMFEDATRFATYKIARKAGKSPQAAALTARDSSFDPDLGGSAVGLVRATFLFGNPALQASKVFLKNLWKNPGKAAVFGGTLMGLKYALNKWNSSVDPDWEEKLKTTTGSNFVKNKTLTFLTGVKDDGSPAYISIPIGYSMVPFAVAADYLQKGITGQMTPESTAEAASEIAEQIAEAYNPTGGTLIPTIVRPYTELKNNKDGLGRTIRPEWLETRPMAARERMYTHTMDTFGGELAYSLAETTEALGLETSPENIKHLASMFTGGPGGTLIRLINATSDVYNKGFDKVKPKDIPILRRFYGNGYKDKFEDRAGIKSEVEQFTAMDNTERARDSRIASSIYRQLRDAEEAGKPEQAQQVLQEAIKFEQLTPSVLKKLKNKLENKEKGLTQTDTRVKQLSVKVRADYLLKQMKKKSLPEVKEYILDQMRKGILTDRVLLELGTKDDFKNLSLRRIE